MTRFASAISLLALLAAAPAAAQAARDFQLPPGPTPTPTSRVQGPIDPDAPVVAQPRVIETPRPATPTPAPVVTATPTIVLPAPAPAARTGRVPAVRPTPQQTAPTQTIVDPSVTSAVPTPLAQEATPTPLPLPLPLPSATAAQRAPASVAAAPDEPATPWMWPALGGIALVAAGAFLAWRRRAPGGAPAILAPALSSKPSDPTDALAITVEAVRMDRSVLNATVGYRVTLRNRTARPLTEVGVEADLVSASRERPAEQQLASPQQALTPRHHTERVAPGQSLRFEGQVRLPLSEASAIWQGRVGLLVPLLRVRATAAGALPVATTLVIGRAEGAAARPQPFRLDEPPRSYAPLAQRVLDAVPARA